MRIQTIKFLRTTKANLDAQKAINNLIVGEPYFITNNTSKLALATAVNDYETYYNASETQSKLDIKIEQASCGALSNAVCTNNGDGTINVPSLDVTLYNGIRVEKYTLATTNNIALTDNVMNYIVADYNSGSPIIRNTIDVTLINESTIIPLCSVYRNGNFLHTQHWDALGFNLANKIHRSIVKTERYRRENGLALSVFGTRNVALTQGTVYVGAVENVLSAIDSTIDSVIYYTHVGGAWVLSTNTQLNNTQYDNGTNLVTLTANRYAINWLYRGVESQKHLYCVLGSGDYTLTQAQTAQPPSIPTAISSHAILVGRIIIQKDSNTATQIDSAFDLTFNQTSIVEDLIRSAVSTLTIDCSTADIFEVTLTANASFSLTNIPTNKDKAFEILNNSGAEITITLPTSQFWESQTVPIGAGKIKEFTVRSNGTRQIWHVSAELKNA